MLHAYLTIMSNIQSERLSLEQRVARLEDELRTIKESVPAIKAAGKQPAQKLDEKFIVENMSGRFVQDSVMFALLSKGQQTRDQIKKTLDDWGIPYRKWFGGGNLRNRLIKTGLVRVVEKNEAGEEVFALTIRGTSLATEKFNSIKNKVETLEKSVA